MPFAIAAGLAGAGIIGNLVGTAMQADAQQNIANAQLASAQNDRATAIAAASPSTQELIQMAEQIELQSRAMARQQKLLDAIDPTIIEAGAQALKLMRGQEASVIAPLRAERARQRGELLNKLRGQLGTGAESSSTGLEALNRFDTETASLIADKQQQSLGDLLKVGLLARPNPYQAVQSNIATLGALRAPRERLVSAINATPITPYAGAGFVGAAYNGAQVAGLGTGLTQAGSQLATLQMLRGGSSAAARTGNTPMSDYQADFNTDFGSLA